MQKPTISFRSRAVFFLVVILPIFLLGASLFALEEKNLYFFRLAFPIPAGIILFIFWGWFAFRFLGAPAWLSLPFGLTNHATPWLILSVLFWVGICAMASRQIFEWIWDGSGMVVFALGVVAVTIYKTRFKIRHAEQLAQETFDSGWKRTARWRANPMVEGRIGGTYIRLSELDKAGTRYPALVGKLFCEEFVAESRTWSRSDMSVLQGEKRDALALLLASPDSQLISYGRSVSLELKLGRSLDLNDKEGYELILNHPAEEWTPELLRSQIDAIRKFARA